jgi:hypothetical protein
VSMPPLVTVRSKMGPSTTINLDNVTSWDDTKANVVIRFVGGDHLKLAGEQAEQFRAAIVQNTLAGVANANAERRAQESFQRGYFGPEK